MWRYLKIVLCYIFRNRIGGRGGGKTIFPTLKNIVQKLSACFWEKKTTKNHQFCTSIFEHKYKKLKVTEAEESLKNKNKNKLLFNVLYVFVIKKFQNVMVVQINYKIIILTELQ